MRHLRALLACSLVACAVALPAAPSASASSPAGKVVNAVNEIRARHGLHRLRVSRSLKRSSRHYAVWMLKHDYFGHRSTIGVSRRFRSAGETLAMHSGWRPRWRWCVRAWMHSPPHRRLLLSRRFQWIGVGVARGRMGRDPYTTFVAHLGGR